MVEGSLVQLAVLLGVAAIAAPVAKRLRIGSVIGYLAGGLFIGPYGLALFAEVESILHVAEFGVISELTVGGSPPTCAADDVVLGVVGKPAQQHRALGRLGFGRG